MATKLLTQDFGPIRQDGESAQPLAADVVIALLELDARAMVAVVLCREMEVQAHVERLANGPQLLKSRVIETGEVAVVKGRHDRVGQHDGARHDGVMRR